MNRLLSTRRLVPAAFGMAFVATALLAACSDSSPNGFGDDNKSIVPEASVDDSADASNCQLQCSLDGRSVISTCTGEVLETCSAQTACGAGRCQDPCSAAAADRSSNGCDFYFQTSLMDKGWEHSCHAAFIVNTSLQPANVQLELEGKVLDTSKSVFQTKPGTTKFEPHTGAIAPGESVILFVSDTKPGTPMNSASHYVACPLGTTPANYDDTVPDMTGVGASLHLTSDVPVSLTSMFPFGGAASYHPAATLVLPVATWAKEHMVVDGWSASASGVPGTQIVASEDGTDVTIVPTVDILDGHDVVGVAARKSATYRIDRGQILQIAQGEDLTGSIVTSTKPTTIFGGNTCASIPTGAGACDMLLQQIPAFEQWGNEYVGVAYRPRTRNEHEPVPYRIVAARDGTRLDYDPEIPPGAPTTLNAGEVATFLRGTGDAFVVRTQDVEHPIYVSAHMTGGNGDGNTAPNFDSSGDPEFVNVVPAKQYLNAYSFYADPTFAEISLVIVRRVTDGPNKHFEDVWLECAGTLERWKPVGTRGEYEFTRVDLARSRGPGETFGDGGSATTCMAGLQRMRSNGPFTATIWGWDYFSSYAYPGGQAQRKLVNTSLIVH
ncbi:hypothetical protein AKJ09_00503 [Labilithrix luteola]|uniref:IgGFc-binding protein N-terminal domain-containing protein n=1 Tax=Labilithrix luteola TaxID=1391654 RepID=A0A0K1PL43_9BACT|nr:IgGFc-binding protein [Labilithrix luteola]AKU93839.1 hypothetical protein AKJ09_00503 [Labilithrix luteola]